MKTFKAKIPDCDIEFELKWLSLRRTGEVLSLCKEFRDEGGSAVDKIQQALQICVAGWNRQEPLSEVDDFIDLHQSMMLIRAAMAGNAVSEDERKK
jgi:hypothetical protein